MEEVSLIDNCGRGRRNWWAKGRLWGHLHRTLRQCQRRPLAKVAVQGVPGEGKGLV